MLIKPQILGVVQPHVPGSWRIRAALLDGLLPLLIVAALEHHPAEGELGRIRNVAGVVRQDGFQDNVVECPGAFPVLFVHDEIVVEADADKAEAAVDWLKKAMLDGMKDVIAPVPCEVEIGIVPTWGG